MQNLDETRDELGFRNAWKVIKETRLKPGNNCTSDCKGSLIFRQL